MLKSPLEKIQEAVEQSKKYPNPIIEYNLELPKSIHVKTDNFFGVNAKFNKNVTIEKGCNVIFKY